MSLPFLGAPFLLYFCISHSRFVHNKDCTLNFFSQQVPGVGFLSSFSSLRFQGHNPLFPLRSFRSDFPFHGLPGDGSRNRRTLSFHTFFLSDLIRTVTI